MPTAQQIESAVRSVRDQRSFIQKLLTDALGWQIDEAAEQVEDISYEWSADDLRSRDLDKHVADGVVRQLVPEKGNPWGIFLLEFKKPDVFLAQRGMTGPLRAVLRGLVPSKRKSSKLKSFDREHLLFICTHDYKHFRFAYFKAPKKELGTAPLAAFGWSPGDPIRTLCEFNLLALARPDGKPDAAAWIAAWAEAFDVEKVTKRFYEDYAAVFAAVEKSIGKSKEVKGEDLRMFTQTLFNRLMFLRFIERKGWLKFNGRTDYLRALHDAGPIGKKSFYKSRVKPLFFEGLAKEKHEARDAIGDVPFLNGGLFEQSELDKQVADIPGEAFERIIGREGLFYRYNFTVEESTPLDIEVAVDPEMLGKVFEELVTGRHESGSYYTPRPVVSFMCREALKGVIAERAKASAETIEALVDRHELKRLTETQARDVIQALDDLKAVDPACGSGAYLLGLLHEMIEIYRLLFNERITKDKRTLHELKLRIISNNLYGVDIDPFATNIAMLRLWLSLSVEADEPVSLPNLDITIETGDSLLGPNPQDIPDLFRAQLRALSEPLIHVKRQYKISHGKEKDELRALRIKLERQIQDGLSSHLGENIIDWRIHFAEVFSGNRGFDIVLANPPYVRKENIDKVSKPVLKARYPELPGQSDLYCYFYIRALELLRPKGMHIFVCSNSWLDSTYGQALQRQLLANGYVVCILESGIERQFATADVNTVISVIQKSRPSADVFSRFISLRAPFVQAIADTKLRREIAVRQDELWAGGQVQNGHGNGRREYQGSKWGGRYLRAPEIYHEILRRNANRLLKLTQLAEVQGYIHDNNTGDDFPKVAFLKSVKNTDRIRVDADTPGVIRYGVKGEGNSRIVSPILFPRTFGSRQLIVWNVGAVYGKEFYKIIPRDSKQSISIVAQLNSTFGLLQRELLGLVNLGEGAIKFSADDVGLFELIADLDVEQVSKAFGVLSERRIGDPDYELQQPDRCELDRAIFAALGLSAAEQREVNKAALDLVKARLTKAITVTK